MTAISSKSRAFADGLRLAIGRVLWWFVEPVERRRQQRRNLEEEIDHARRMIARGITRVGGEDLHHRIASLTRRLEEQN